MPRTPRPVSSLLLLAAVLLACGIGDEVNEMREATEAMGQYAEGMQEFAEQMEEANERGPAEPVDFRELREFLPDDALGIAQTNQGGERNSVGQGLSYSTANRVYEDGDRRFSVNVTDTAGVPIARAGFMALAIDIDREDDNGYTRTGEFEGHRSMEEYRASNQSGTLTYIVENRFLVVVEGRGVTMDEIKRVANQVDHRALRGLRDFGYAS